MRVLCSHSILGSGSKFPQSASYSHLFCFLAIYDGKDKVCYWERFRYDIFPRGREWGSSYVIRRDQLGYLDRSYWGIFLVFVNGSRALYCYPLWGKRKGFPLVVHLVLYYFIHRFFFFIGWRYFNRLVKNRSFFKMIGCKTDNPKPSIFLKKR